MNFLRTTLSAAAFMLAGGMASEAANLFRDLDASTLQVARTAVQTALEERPQGQVQRWSVPGVASGAVMPRRTWKSATGHWCREFEETLQMADGRTQNSVSVRCRSADGRWRQTGR